MRMRNRRSWPLTYALVLLLCGGPPLSAHAGGGGVKSTARSTSHATRHVHAARRTAAKSAKRRTRPASRVRVAPRQDHAVPEPGPNGRVLRNIRAIFDGERHRTGRFTVYVRDGVIRRIIPTEQDGRVLAAARRRGLPIEDTEGLVLMAAGQDSERHVHPPDRVLASLASEPGTGEPVRNVEGAAVRVPLGRLWRRMVDRGVQSLSPYDFPYGHEVGKTLKEPHKWTDDAVAANFGVLTHADMQSSADDTADQRWALEARLDRHFTPERLERMSLEERLQLHYARQLPRTLSSGSWFIPGELIDYYPSSGGTRRTMNIGDGWSAKRIDAEVKRRRDADGASYIKVYYDRRLSAKGAPSDRPTMTKETLAAIVRSAHEHGMRAFVHAHTVTEAEEALAAGADCLIHIPSDRDLSPKMLRLATRRNPKRLHPEEPAYVMPTLSVLFGDAPVRTNDEVVAKYVGQQLAWTRPHADKIDRYLSIMDIPRLMALAPKSPKDSTHDYRQILRNVALAHERGVPLVVGVDASGLEPIVPGLGVWYEAHLIASALHDFGGLPEKAALVEGLKAATSNPHALLADLQFEGRAPYGLVREGYAGDFVLTRQDPTRGILEAVAGIHSVYKAGFEVPRRELMTKPDLPRQIAEELLRAGSTGRASRGE